ncbi:amidase [Allopusillimonas ginsengisoli]|nr:amidase [Allopusillimonas ginsengisoli]
MTHGQEAKLAQVFSAYSDWVGYGHEDRAHAWLQRLTINHPEIELFRSLPTPSAQPFQPRDTSIRAASGTLSSCLLPHSNMPADATSALARAKELNPLWHLFCTFAEQPESASAGYLSGVPVAVKDMIRVRGMAATGGSASGDLAPAQEDATCVGRLRAHGAVVIGMANQHEMAFGASSDNPVYGRVINPVSTGHIPGGSSGGSAAIVAAGITRVTLGTDTGGSIRLPAACCGVVGFKPTYDSVPRHGAIDVAPTLDHLGPLGKYVKDCAQVFAALLDLPEEPNWALENLSGLRVGRLDGYFVEPLDGQVRAALDAACEAMRQDQAQLSTVSLSSATMASALQFMTITTEAAASYEDRLLRSPEKLSEEVRIRLEIANFLPAPWYVRAQRMRTQLANDIDALFDQVDVLICPTMRSPAPEVGASHVTIDSTSYPLHTAVTQLTMPFSLSGSPAISIPWGVAGDGAPIGLQLIARHGDDWRLLAVAQRLESACPQH